MSSGSRYETIHRLAAGGMATVWIGAARGALGFRQLVAIKRPHPHLLMNPGFKNELIAEARLASMIHHANVVDVRDVELVGDEMSLVMDYIEGASLGELLVAASRRQGDKSRLPARVVVRIVRDTCAGLHAAHELVDERDRPLGLVHRDVSPQNILVGTDGISRVTDFGVAKFSRKYIESTNDGSLKGKLAYMAPEYLTGERIDRRFDVFATGVVLWESLTGRRLFRGASEAETLHRVLEHVPERVSSIVPGLEALDDVVACALMKEPKDRFQNAAAMGVALEAAATAAGLLGAYTEVAETLEELAGADIGERRALVRSKLAHEPTVGSIGKMSAAAPATVALPAAAPAPVPPAVASAHVSTVTAPNVAPALDEPVPATMVSNTPTAVRLARAPGRAAVLAAAPGNTTLRSEDLEGSLAAPVIHLPAVESAPAGLPRRAPLVAIAAGVVVLVLLAGAGVFAVTKRSSATSTAEAASAPSAAASSALAPPSAVPPAASSAAPSASVVAPEPSTQPTRTAPASSVRRPAPRTAPTPTIKRPPANPYE